MDFKLDQCIDILYNTPTVVASLLNDLDRVWAYSNEGEDSWSPYDIVGHLIHGEKTDWIPRARIILSDGDDKTFIPFDRFAQFEESAGQSLEKLLDTFSKLRLSNLNTLNDWDLQDSDYQKVGFHPEFGRVTLSQLLATWVVHDLSHISQISRVMAKQYKSAVGPWNAYIPLLHR